MSLRRPVLLGLVIGFVSVFSLSGHANAQEKSGVITLSQSIPVGKVALIWPELDPGQRSMVDLLAADFFQNELSEAQRARIFSAGAEDYRKASARERDAIRAQRREEWQARAGSGQSGDSLTYEFLTDSQKAPFRRYAIDQLGIDLPEMGQGAAGRNRV